MMVIMTPKEYQSVLNKIAIENADIVVVLQNGKAKIEKNRYSGVLKELSYVEVLSFLDAYLKLCC